MCRQCMVAAAAAVAATAACASARAASEATSLLPQRRLRSQAACERPLYITILLTPDPPRSGCMLLVFRYYRYHIFIIYVSEFLSGVK